MRRGAAVLIATVLLGGCGGATASTTTLAPDEPTTTAAAATTTSMGEVTTTTLGRPIALDDPDRWREPEGLSYRFTQEFLVTVGGAYGAAIEGRSFVSGGKLLGPPAEYLLVLRLEPYGDEPTCRDLREVSGFQDPYHLLLDVSGFLTGEAYLLEEGITVGGRLVERYAFGIDAIADTQMIEEIDVGYIDFDRDGGFVVQLHYKGRGVSRLTGPGNLPGTLEFTLLVSEFGTVAALTAPEGC